MMQTVRSRLFQSSSEMQTRCLRGGCFGCLEFEGGFCDYVIQNVLGCVYHEKFGRRQVVQLFMSALLPPL